MQSWIFNITPVFCHMTLQEEIILKCWKPVNILQYKMVRTPPPPFFAEYKVKNYLLEMENYS